MLKNLIKEWISGIFFLMNEFSLIITNQSRLLTRFVRYTNSTIQQKNKLLKDIQTPQYDQKQATESSSSCIEPSYLRFTIASCRFLFCKV
jgi:hypothetical protein